MKRISGLRDSIDYIGNRVGLATRSVFGGIKYVGIYLTILTGILMTPCLFDNAELSETRHRPTPSKPVENRRPVPRDYSEMTWREVIREVGTRQEAQQYLNRHFTYDNEEKGTTIGETFRTNHTRRKGVCLDYATASAALRSDDDIPPLLLTMWGPQSAHAVHLYEEGGKLGASGNTPRDPVHSTVAELVLSLGDFDRYSIVDLDEVFPNRSWVDGDMDLVKICSDKCAVKIQK